MSDPNPPTPSPPQRNGGLRPVPDPTELTDRAIAKVRAELLEIMEGRLAVRDERLRGIDEATKLRLDSVAQTADQFSEQVDRLREVHDEKFASVQTQFGERDTRAEREARDNTKAVDAAFAAQKESAAREGEANAKAIDKSERATTETIKTNQELNKATTDSLTKSLDEVKLAVTRIESTKVGVTESRAETRTATTDSRSLSFAIIGSLIGGAGLAFGIAMAIANAPKP